MDNFLLCVGQAGFTGLFEDLIMSIFYYFENLFKNLTYFYRLLCFLDGILVEIILNPLFQPSERGKKSNVQIPFSLNFKQLLKVELLIVEYSVIKHKEQAKVPPWLKFKGVGKNSGGEIE
jgi:hypothetical protein